MTIHVLGCCHVSSLGMIERTTYTCHQTDEGSHAELKNTYCVYSSWNSLLWKTEIHKYLTKNKKNILIQRKIYRYKSIIKEGQFWLFFKDNLLVYYF